MSHELRTPLNAIIGFAEIMDAELFGPVSVEQYRNYIHDILYSARRVLQIVEDVLEISSAETQQLLLHKHEVDVSAIITAAVAKVQRLSGERKLNLTIAVEPDLIVLLDPAKIERVVTCLLSNAVKFSPPGAPIVMSATGADQAMVAVTIEDHGIGMSADLIDLAFAPFVQLDDRLSRQFDGAGLGLPLARLLAQLHGGNVELESQLGKGTIARLTLPRYAGRGS